MLKQNYFRDYFADKHKFPIPYAVDLTDPSTTDVSPSYSVAEALDICNSIYDDLSQGAEKLKSIMAVHPFFVDEDTYDGAAMKALGDIVRDLMAHPFSAALPTGDVINLSATYEDDISTIFVNGSLFFGVRDDGAVNALSRNDIVLPSGRTFSILDLGNYITESIQHSAIMSSAIQQIASGSATPAAFKASFAQWGASMLPSSDELITQLSQCLHYNDGRPVLQLVADYLKRFALSQPDDEAGVMSFSSTAWSIETGIIFSFEGVFDAVSTFVSTILMAIKPVIGFVVSAIGNIAASIFNAPRDNAVNPTFNVNASAPTYINPIAQVSSTAPTSLRETVLDRGMIRYQVPGYVGYAWNSGDNDLVNYELFLDLRYNIIPNGQHCCGLTMTTQSDGELLHTILTIPGRSWYDAGFKFSGSYSYPSGYYSGNSVPITKDILRRVLSAMVFTVVSSLNDFTVEYYDDYDTTYYPAYFIKFDWTSVYNTIETPEKFLNVMCYWLRMLDSDSFGQTQIDDLFALINNSFIPQLRFWMNATATELGVDRLVTRERTFTGSFSIPLRGAVTAPALAYATPMVKPVGAITHFLTPPQQTLSSWLGSVVLTSAAAVAVAATSAMIYYGARKAANRAATRRRLNSKRAELAYANDPSDENLRNVIKSARVEKRWNTIFGQSAVSSTVSDTAGFSLDTLQQQIDGTGGILPEDVRSTLNDLVNSVNEDVIPTITAVADSITEDVIPNIESVQQSTEQVSNLIFIPKP